MTPNSPWLCLKSSRVKLTAAVGAPAFAIWLMRQSPSPGWDDLSQTAWAEARNCGETCHTAEASIFAGLPCDCAVAHPANQARASSKRALRILFPRRPDAWRQPKQQGSLTNSDHSLAG